MVRPEVWDVIVCGAGVGGCVAAERLAEKGFSTLLLERKSIPRYKACGGAVTQDFIDEYKLPEGIIRRRIEYLVLHHAGYDTLEKRGKGACLWRSDLDSFLARRAASAGAILREQAPVVSAERERDLYVVKTTGERFLGKMLIAADGVASRVLRCFGWERIAPTDLAQTVTHEIELGEDVIANRFGGNHLHLYFGHSVSRMGYGWVFPKRRTVSVGWGCQLSIIRNVRDEFGAFLRMLGDQLAGGRLVRRAAHLLPAGLRRRFGDRGLLSVGDAAGLVDPISGKGIPYAAASGRLAAEAAAQALESGEVDQAAAYYESLLEASMLGVLRAKKAIQKDVYRSEENISRFLRLWLTHRSTVIATSLWRTG